jgi:hypothetical protein
LQRVAARDHHVVAWPASAVADASEPRSQDHAIQRSLVRSRLGRSTAWASYSTLRNMVSRSPLRRGVGPRLELRSIRHTPVTGQTCRHERRGAATSSAACASPPMLPTGRPKPDHPATSLACGIVRHDRHHGGQFGRPTALDAPCSLSDRFIPRPGTRRMYRPRSAVRPLLA